ncbi:MAG: SCP2 sterol-binding domain-containing protein [Burkholderiales bacterium]|nr:SCP2 sterol-binding domain-containing protein [Burkholderiales bacterium]
MTEPTREFFTRLAEQHQPALESMTGVVRFDIYDGERTEHWHLRIRKGDVTVSHEGPEADCVLSADIASFDAILTGKMNAMAAVLRWVPALRQTLSGSALGEFRVLRHKQVWLALGMSVLASTSLFTMFTYITPILRDVTGVAPQNVSGVLLLCGVGLTIGNLLGGRLADWKLMPSLMAIFAALAAVLTTFSYTSAWLWPAIITLMVWGMASFAVGAPLQVRVVSQAGEASSLASTLNIGAFNLGNALGAWLGGAVIDLGWSLQTLPLVSAGVAVCALGLTAYTARLDRRPVALQPAMAGCNPS